MSKNSLHNKQVDTNAIERINDGILVLKHFLKLNQELLPIYYELHQKEEKTSKVIASIIKIDTLFSSFNFDSSTSRVIMDSSILDDIHQAYFTIQNQKLDNEKKEKALEKFFNELKRLKQNWELVEAN